jgi:hypothetical protein
VRGDRPGGVLGGRRVNRPRQVGRVQHGLGGRRAHAGGVCRAAARCPVGLTG